MNESRNSRMSKFLCLFPSVLAILFTGLYALGVLPTQNLVFVNILCIPLALLEMTLGFIDGINGRKATYFASSTVICALASLINIQIGGEFAPLLDLPMWAKVWLIALGISLVAFLVMLIRLFRWRQEDWEKAKSISQELRLQRKQERAQRWLATRAHRTSLSEQKHAYQSESAEQKYTHRREVQSAKEKHARERQDENYRESRSARSKRSNAPVSRGDILRVLTLIALIALYFLIPIWQTNIPGIESWVTNVHALVGSLLGESSDNMQDALLYYTILYVLIIAVIGSVIFIIFKTVGRSPTKEESLGRALADKYGTPSAILIVAGMALVLILGGGDLHRVGILQEGTSDVWASLFTFIIFILTCLTAVELVRLTLAQCLQPGSLLNKLFRLIFVVTLDFLASFILSVITRFRIQSLVSSLLELVFPDQNEKLQKRIDSLLNNLLIKELDTIMDDSGNDPTSPSGGFQKFWRKRTWRRRK